MAFLKEPTAISTSPLRRYAHYVATNQKPSSSCREGAIVVSDFKSAIQEEIRKKRERESYTLFDTIQAKNMRCQAIFDDN